MFSENVGRDEAQELRYTNQLPGAGRRIQRVSCSFRIISASFTVRDCERKKLTLTNGFCLFLYYYSHQRKTNSKEKIRVRFRSHSV